MKDLLLSAKLKALCERNGISYLGVFGSYARGDNDPNSDLDLLVEYTRPVGYLTHAQVQNSFEDYFKVPVDLVFKNSIKPRIVPHILADLKTIYEKR